METNRRQFLKFVGGGIFTICLPSCSSITKPLGSEKRPNFIFILSDDQGWSGTSAQMHAFRADSKSDYYFTPNLERLASQGMRFSQGYAPAPICTPTRRSIQYGMTPARQRGSEFTSTFKLQDHLSIPQILKSIDPEYATAHFGKWGSRMGAHPKEVGYDASDGQTRNPVGGFDHKNKDPWGTYTIDDDPKRIFSVTDRALGFMEKQAQADRPFYLQISHYAVHVDIETQRKTLEKYQAKKLGKIHKTPAFGGMTEDMDTGIGKVLDMVQELGIADSTYIFFMSDNGGVPRMPLNFAKRVLPPDPNDPFQNYPLRGGKWTLFEGGVRVPFIVKGPGIKANSFCNEPVVGWDLLPTFSELAGNTKPLPSDLDGRSFARMLKNNGKGHVKRDFEGLVFHAPFKNPGHSAIRVGDYKLVKFYDPEKLLLFNLKEDMEETKDLAQQMPDKTKALHEALKSYLTRVGARFPEKK